MKFLDYNPTKKKRRKHPESSQQKNTSSEVHDISQTKFEEIEPEEQVKKSQIDEFFDYVEQLSNFPNSKHNGYIVICS
jgi:hypothetical protein